MNYKRSINQIKEEIRDIKIGGEDCRNKCHYYDWSVGACQGICEEYVKNEAIEIVNRILTDWSEEE